MSSSVMASNFCKPQNQGGQSSLCQHIGSVIGLHGLNMDKDKSAIFNKRNESPNRPFVVNSSHRDLFP